jgi:hypothetical protein
MIQSVSRGSIGTSSTGSLKRSGSTTKKPVTKFGTQAVPAKTVCNVAHFIPKVFPLIHIRNSTVA